MYQERYKDMNVQKVVWVFDGDRLVQMEIYGEQQDGTSTWLLLHIAPNHEETTKEVEC